MMRRGPWVAFLVDLVLFTGGCPFTTGDDYELGQDDPAGDGAPDPGGADRGIQQSAPYPPEAAPPPCGDDKKHECDDHGCHGKDCRPRARKLDSGIGLAQR